MPFCPAISLRAALLLMAAVVLIGVDVAHAGQGYAAGATWKCSSAGAGGRDSSGALYTPCTGSQIAIQSADGRTQQLVQVSVGGSTGIKPFQAVAPTPDGGAIYTISHASGNASTAGMTLQRLTINAARTSASLDTTFRPQRFMAGGTPHDVCGYGIATDAYGFVYVSNGGWCSTSAGGTSKPEPNMIVKYAPDGSVVTAFGDYGTKLGTFNVNMQLAVSRDGRRVYVADHLNTRVQYFDWTLDGTYRFAGSFNSVTINGQSVPFSATYGVALDPWGNVYVADTTQARIFKTTADGTFIAQVVDLPSQSSRIHSLAVDAIGNVYVAEAQLVYRRASDNPAPTTTPQTGPEPKVDLLPPTLRGVTGPKSTTDATVSVQLDATDDVAVREMRFADERGEWGPWQPFAASTTIALTDRPGYKSITAQVRDGRQFESETRTITLQRTTLVIADTVAPTVSVTAPASVPVTNTVARVSIAARDNTGVTQLRVAREDGEFGAWRPWSASNGTLDLDIDLGSAPGYRAVFVQVIDAAFNISDTASVNVRVGDDPATTNASTSNSNAAAPTGASTRPGAAGPSTPSAANAVARTEPGVAAAPRDTAAPTALAVRTPARSCSRSITLRIGARDNVRVTRYRVANEDGRFGAWKQFRSVTTHRLSAGPTTKRITVQVADAAGNVSSSRSQRVTLVRCAAR